MRTKAIRPSEVVDAVSVEFRVSYSDLVSKTRHGEVRGAKNAMTYLLYHSAKRSHPEIAEYLGLRSHSSSVGRVRAAEKAMHTDQNFKATVERIAARLEVG